MVREHCPAAELTRGTLSLNRLDVRCRVSGLLRDADGSPCVQSDAPSGYCACAIWRTEKERVWQSGKANKATKMLNAGMDGWS